MILDRLPRLKRNLVLLGIGLLVLWFSWSIRSVLNPLLLGYLCAYILHPFVERVQQLGLSKRSAVNLIFFSGFVGASVLSLVIVLQTKDLAEAVVSGIRGPALAEVEGPGVDPASAGTDPSEDTTEDASSGDLELPVDVTAPSRDLPEGGDGGSGGDDPPGTEQEEAPVPGGADDVDPPRGEEGADGEPSETDDPEEDPVGFEENFQGKWESLAATIEDWTSIDIGPAPNIDVPVLRDWARGFLADHSGTAGDVSLVAAQKSWGFLSRFLGGIIAVGGLFLLVPLYTYYLLFELGRMHGFVRRYLPKRDRAQLSEVAEKIGAVIANFFRGRLAVCFLKGLFLSVGLWATGIEYAFLFGMLSGFLSLIPFFGPFIGFVVATTAGILDHSILGAMLRTGIVFGVGEVLEGYVLIPKVLGDSLGLHPLVVLFAMLAGGAAMGMLGILIALPLTAALVILFKEFVLPAMEKMADEDSPPPAAAG